MTSGWVLGRPICDVWISLDVLCCTSSILHLVAISLDRYWAVTRVDYVRGRTAQRILFMIGLSWALSAVIAMAPLVGWGRSRWQPSEENGAELKQESSRERRDNDSYWLISNTSIPAETNDTQLNVTNPFQTTNTSQPLEEDLNSDVFHSVKLSIALLMNTALTDSTSKQQTENSPVENENDYEAAGEDDNEMVECIISQDKGYTIFSTVGAFYIPLIFMMIIYALIYRTAQKRIRGGRHAKNWTAESTTVITNTSTSGPRSQHSGSSSGGRLRSHSVGGVALYLTTKSPKLFDVSKRRRLTEALLLEERRHSASNDTRREGSLRGGDGVVVASPSRSLASTALVSPARSSCVTTDSVASFASCSSDDRIGQSVEMLETGENSTVSSFRDNNANGGNQKKSAACKEAEKKARKREKREQMRERKAARTLAIITGSFTVCWMPFFIIALIHPFCGESCSPPPLLMSVIAWLGYTNSLLNPIIYTIFSPDFRLAFRKILYGRYNSADAGNKSRLRKK